jgi:hypothetical protein
MAAPRKFTLERLSQIPFLLEQGFTPEQIATEFGSTIGSLRVRCSQNGIPLRRKGRIDRLSAAMNKYQTLQVSEQALASLERVAGEYGVSITELAVRLLQIIAADDLFSAVLDMSSE